MTRLRSLFLGQAGLRHGWRFVIFAAAIILAFQFVEGPVILFFAVKFHLDLNALTAQLLILSEIVGFVIVLTVTGAAALLERRRIDSYGLPVNRRFGRLFWDGAFVGLLTIIFVGLAMLAADGMQVHGLALHGKEIITSSILWLVGMLLVGVSEEYLFRGYALQSLWRAAGFWPAALITSGLFAGAHLSKPHENAIDIGMIFALGVILCLSVQVTGSLWWAVGWHATFDFGQFFIIGTRNGGQLPVGRLFDATFSGPAWINGGELGTEASYFMIPAAVATFIYVQFFLVRRASPLESHLTNRTLRDA
ncbi:MAG: hypothetical protein DMF34_10965 [Verrucomicrobia bacterium]|nr:MAG: hypothetical protein DMF34_10965 [Verrucomicrobiota bacterium]